MYSYKEQMGLALIPIEDTLKSLGLVVSAVHKNGFHYFTVENDMRAQVYCQVDTYCNGYSLSSKYRPYRNEGSGRRIADNLTLQQLIPAIMDSFQISLMHAITYGFPKTIRV